MPCFDLKHQRETLWQALHCACQQTTPDGAALADTLHTLAALEGYWAYPDRGVMQQLQDYLENGQFCLLAQLVRNVWHQLQDGRYRLQPFHPFQTCLEQLNRPLLHENHPLSTPWQPVNQPYFEVLVVDPLPEASDALYRPSLAAFTSAHDGFVYAIVRVSSAQEAITAVLANTDIQVCVYRYPMPLATNAAVGSASDSVEVALCRRIRSLRPGLDHYLLGEPASAGLASPLRAHFDRVLLGPTPFQDLHAAILSGIRQRFVTPFFDALQAYARQPKGVFHALPLSRGASIKDSPWAHDMLDFYGGNIFLAETSSTLGGLDSLLEPTGAIKQAQVKTAQTFGADNSYFVTNGTSTSNKIVYQANVLPGDIVLIGSDCHKSIPYAAMLAGAEVIFLETWPLPLHDLYGGVALAHIKAVLLDLKARGALHRVRQITLTNSTFDGLIYPCEHYMREILALKPDIIFHWDEAWFAFARFHPLYQRRTAMAAVQQLRWRLQSPQYRAFYARWQAKFAASSDPAKWQQPLYPDPAQVQLRVYATQSTHKTLSAFRQGSVIHVTDDQFEAAAFLEAYRIHTSTSPNYQILASLDIARRQMALEGFHLVRNNLLLALQLRQRIREAVALQPFFELLDDADMMDPTDRPPSPPAAVATATTGECELAVLSARWGESDCVLDPTRVTLNVRNTGLDGSSFRQLLMNHYDIQVNKTSRYTVLFLINIGASQASIDYLMQVLLEMAARFREEDPLGPHPLPLNMKAAPVQRHYHPAFVPTAPGRYPACDLRIAYFAGARPAQVTYIALSQATIEAVRAGRRWVSAGFITPYPPGFPVVVPGQIITEALIDYFLQIKIKEIHGYHVELGFKVFTDGYLHSLPDHGPDADTPASTITP